MRTYPWKFGLSHAQRHHTIAYHTYRFHILDQADSIHPLLQDCGFDQIKAIYRLEIPADFPFDGPENFAAQVSSCWYVDVCTCKLRVEQVMKWHASMHV